MQAVHGEIVYTHFRFVIVIDCFYIFSCSFARTSTRLTSGLYLIENSYIKPFYDGSYSWTVD